MNIFRTASPHRKWYEIIIWWELRRIPYNILMYFIGLGSFYIAYVSIPLLYVIIGLALNAGYAICWMIELALLKSLNENENVKYPTIAFLSYLVFSTAVVFGFAVYLIL